MENYGNKREVDYMLEKYKDELNALKEWKQELELGDTEKHNMENRLERLKKSQVLTKAKLSIFEELGKEKYPEAIIGNKHDLDKINNEIQDLEVKINNYKNPYQEILNKVEERIKLDDYQINRRLHVNSNDNGYMNF
jgi:hypothetical protein